MVTGNPHGNPAIRQHFLPRCLLRGFSVRERKKHHYVYEYRRNGLIRRGEVGTVGHQRRFYGSNELEQKLAEREGQYAALLESLREGRIESSMKSQIDDFVSHLLVRTNNLRQCLLDLGTAIRDGLMEQFDKCDMGSRIHGKMIATTQSSETLQMIEQEAAKLPEPVRQVFRQLVKEQFSSPDLLQMVRRLAAQALPLIDVPQAVQSAQIRVLEGTENERAKLLKQFEWRLIQYAPNTLILGDHGPLGREKGPASTRGLMLMEGIEKVYLPVSHQWLLLGEVTLDTQNPDPEQLNVSSVELSQDFFVARTAEKLFKDYIPLIGKRAKLFDEGELRNLIDEGLENEP